MGDPTRAAHSSAPAGPVEGEHEGTDDAGTDARRTSFSNRGVVPPPVAGFPDKPMASASDMAFGPATYTPPLARQPDLKARAERLEVQRLLESGSVSSGQEAIGALDLLLQMAPDERTKVVDQLEERALTNLLERLTDDQRARFAPLIDAASDPKRRLKLWGAQHTSRARVDLERYKGDFGDDDDRTDAQEAAKQQFDRRQAGVDSTQAEVASESDALLNKKDLSVADVDAMRARKDHELDVEMKHNINLVAEATPRKDGSDVHWSEGEVASLDRSLDKLPSDEANGSGSVPTYTRRANRNFMQTLGGQYNVNEIDVYDNAHEQPPGRDQVDPVEYAVTHEVGHDVAHDHAAAFTKFSKAAAWHDTDRATLDKQAGDSDVLEGVGSGVHLGNELVKRDDQGKYHAVDDTAMPNGKEASADRWKYAASNAGEHFAEVYAMAVETPDLLFHDYIEEPATRVHELSALVHDQQQALGGLAPGTPEHAALADKLASNTKELAHWEKAAAQRKQLFDIVRNDVFHADKHLRDVVTQLQKRGATADQIRELQTKAARLSTTKQIDELARELVP